MNRYKDEFLADFARLVGVHGMDQLDALAVDLAEPEGRENLRQELERVKAVASKPIDSLIANLSESANGGRVAPPLSESAPFHKLDGENKRASAGGLYADIRVPELRVADSRGAKIFREILNTLTTSGIFQRRRVLDELAGHLNVPTAKRDNRKRIMEKIIGALADMDTDQLTQARVWVRKSDRGSTETFMRFGTFIANGARPNGDSGTLSAEEPETIEVI